MPVLFGFVIRILYFPGIRKLFEKIAEAYDIEFIRRDLDAFNNKHKGLIALNLNQYLPDTEERIARLRRLINKRPVVIILHGPSLKELEENITELKDLDICYLGLNSFSVPEKNILQKINRNFSVVMCSDVNEMRAQFQNNNLIDFLERREDNIVISERKSFREKPVKSLCPDVDKFIQKYDKKLFFFTTVNSSSIVLRGEAFLKIPSVEYPLHFLAQGSFSVLLSLALIGEPKMVVVFGGDGGKIEEGATHYRESGLALEPYFTHPVRNEYILQDTRAFNAAMPLMIKNMNKIFSLKPIDIINCSLHSLYTPLRKLSYKDTFSILKSSG